MLGDITEQTRILPYYDHYRQFNNYNYHITQDSAKTRQLLEYSMTPNSIMLRIIDGDGKQRLLQFLHQLYKREGYEEYINAMPSYTDNRDNWAIAVYPDKGNRSDIICNKNMNEETFFVLEGKAVIRLFEWNQQKLTPREQHNLEIGEKITINKGTPLQIINCANEKLIIAVLCIPAFDPSHHQVLEEAANTPVIFLPHKARLYAV